MATVTKTSYGQNIGNSFKAMLLGIVLFLGSFGVFWYNAGRPNRGKIVEEQSVAVDASALDSEVNQKFISLTGKLTSPELLGDSSYIKPGPYITISRSVQMYAWVEHTRTETEDQVGGGTVETTYYEYAKEWTSSPQSVSKFKQSEVRDWERKNNVKIYNPTLSIQSTTKKVSRAKIGVWTINPRSIGLPGGDALTLSTENVVSGNDIQGQYIYDNSKGGGSQDNPSVGDVRISFSKLDANIEATALGKASGNTITKQLIKEAAKNEVTFYNVYRGTRDDAISAIKAEDKMTGIILILVGFFMMWFGLQMVLGPITTLLKVLPFLGNLSKGIIGVITFAVALVLSLVSIGLFAIFRNVIALVVIIAVILIVVIMAVMKNKKEPAAQA